MQPGSLCRFALIALCSVGCARERPSQGSTEDAAIAEPDAAPAPVGSDAGHSPPLPAAPSVSRYVPPSDAALPAPSCGGQLKPGETRTSVEGVIGRVAIDENGIVYAPTSTPARELALRALDACGKPLWQRVVAPKVPESPVAARLPGSNEVVLDSLAGSGVTQGLWRFDRSGEPLEPLAVQGRPSGFVAANGSAFFLQTYDQSSFLTRLGMDGTEQRWKPPTVARQQTIPTGEEECAVFGGLLACQSVAFKGEKLETLWTTDGLELIDGTTRHCVNPASDGERLYSLNYGVTNYRFSASKVQTGEMLWSHELGPSPSGQFGLATGGPIIGERGWIYLYIAYSRRPVTRLEGDVQAVVAAGEDFGWLIAYDPAGEERFRYVAPHGGFPSFREHATHVAGDDGAIYLATAKGVFAVDGEDAAVRWQRTDLGRIDVPRLALSPNGDLLVQVGDRLSYLATASHGAAHSPWPAPGGDRRNLNAR